MKGRYANNRQRPINLENMQTWNHLCDPRSTEEIKRTRLAKNNSLVQFCKKAEIKKIIKNNKSFNQMLQFQSYLAAPDFWRWTSLPICFVQSNVWATFLGRFTDVTCVAVLVPDKKVSVCFFLSSESDFPLKDFLRLPDPPPLLLLLPWEMSVMQAVKRSIHKKMTTRTVPCMCDCRYMFQGVCCISVFTEGHLLRRRFYHKRFTSICRKNF